MTATEAKETVRLANFGDLLDVAPVSHFRV